MASSRYTVKLKCRPFYPWEPQFPHDTLAKAWINFVAECNEGWVQPVTGQPHVSQNVVAEVLKEFGGRIGKEQAIFNSLGWQQDWFRYVEFKESEGFSMFILRYSS